MASATLQTDLGTLKIELNILNLQFPSDATIQISTLRYFPFRNFLCQYQAKTPKTGNALMWFLIAMYGGKRLPFLYLKQ